MRLNRIAIVFLAAASIALVAPRVRAQVAPTATKDAKDVDMKGSGNGRVVEEIVARVNNEIISYSEYQKSETELHEEVKQDCQGCAQDRLNAMYEER
ncbi:MAG: hypothetical protein WCC76_02940, partial [Candidatus Acidiferrales bacterium]